MKNFFWILGVISLIIGILLGGYIEIRAIVTYWRESLAAILTTVLGYTLIMYCADSYE
jgi:hypothetical protein